MDIKLGEKGHVKPDSFSVTHEKLLIGVATKGGTYISIDKLSGLQTFVLLKSANVVTFLHVMAELSVVKLFNVVSN